MRSFELIVQNEVEEDSSWNVVLALMDEIQSRSRMVEEFELRDPATNRLVVWVQVASMLDTEAWMLGQEPVRKRDDIHFLAKGSGLRFYECMLLGCPKTIRDDCLLSRSDSELGIQMLLDRKSPTGEWHWVPFAEAFERGSD
jgi:hypothetical protein